MSRQILQKFGGIINHGNRKEKRLGEISPGTEREKLFAFAEDYRRFISGCKTERECTAAVYADATGHGFVDLDELIETGKSVKAGDKIIANNMGKGLALFIVGSKPLEGYEYPWSSY